MTNLKNSSAVEFHYKFTLKDGKVKEFHIALNPKTLAILNPPRLPHPSWADLKFQQCPNCPLQEKDFPQCPPAAHLSEFAAFAEGLDSFEEAEIEITTPQRAYRKRTAVQYGLSSLMGIYMATSGCPILDRFRPMVKTHLPFSKPEEATYRMVSMYLLAQFFRMKEGLTPDWELQGLVKTVQEIEIVNQSFWKRITAANLQLKDGGVNALSHLNTIARITTYQLQDKDLQDLKILFSSYLK